MYRRDKEQQKKYNREYRRARVASGQCAHCSSMAAEGSTSCEACGSRMREQNRLRREKYRQAGCCIQCGKESIPQERLCTKCRKRSRSSWHILRGAALDAYGRKCACCGEDEQLFLAIDHVNEDGARQRRQLGSGGVYRWLRDNNYPPGFQTLCYNCNRGKHVNGGTCPHCEPK